MGTKLWGCISHISASELTISLPGGLKGFISASETSDIFANEAAKPNRGKGVSAEEAEGTVSPVVWKYHFRGVLALSGAWTQDSGFELGF